MRDAATRRRVWYLVAGLCTLTVAAAVTAAAVGLANRDPVPAGTQLPAAETTERPVPASVSEPAPAGTTASLASAEFRSLDASTSGTATLLTADGGMVLRLSSFETERGLGYVLYLVPRADARSPGDGALLGELKAAAGDQNYLVPAAARTEGPLTVLVWSRGFKGPVAHAVLRH